MPESDYNCIWEMKMIPEKEEAKRLIESLPENASWDDIMCELYVKKKLSESLKAASKRKIVPHEEVKKRFSSQ